MDFSGMVRIACFFILVASGETLNGIGRTLYLNKRLGVVNARRLSILPALFLCLLICYFYVPVLGIVTARGLLLLGVALSSFMLLFDILLARLVMHAGWSAIAGELNIFKGNLLGLGVVVMAFCPLLSSMLRRVL